MVINVRKFDATSSNRFSTQTQKQSTQKYSISTRRSTATNYCCSVKCYIHFTHQLLLVTQRTIINTFLK